LWFSEIFEKGGFDIVIGNPPYIQLQKDGGKLANVYEPCGFETFEKTGDIYSLFYEKGYDILKPHGHLIYITSNKWMRAAYGATTRSFFAQNTNPKLLIDFAGQKIFESATVDTNILLFSKEENAQETRACIVKEKVLNKLSVFVSQNAASCKFVSDHSWVINSFLEQQIIAKIERLGTPLKDWDVCINYGVKTGFNDAFIIDQNKRQELIMEDSKSEEIIRPILRGRDIKRYGYDYADQYLIALLPSKKLDIEHFPAIKKHLLTFGSDILVQNGYAWVADDYLEEWCFKRLQQTGEQIIINNEKIKIKGNEKSRKATANKWFETQDSISYWEDFSKQKIVWGNLNLKATYSLAEEGIYVNAPCPIIVPANKYILGILNSKLADYYVRGLGVTRNGGYFEYKPMFIEQIPIPIIEESQQEQFASLVTKIISNKKNGSDTEKLEEELDHMIFKLYQLSAEEIAFLTSLSDNDSFI
jgi:hypothetical protein